MQSNGRSVALRRGRTDGRRLNSACRAAIVRLCVRRCVTAPVDGNSFSKLFAYKSHHISSLTDYWHAMFQTSVVWSSISNSHVTAHACNFNNTIPRPKAHGKRCQFFLQESRNRIFTCVPCIVVPVIFRYWKLLDILELYPSLGTWNHVTQMHRCHLSRSFIYILHIQRNRLRLLN